ncbi:hypothetical protein HQ42_04040 [Porphyromonas gulae]|uniref:Uncharacterized protein n=2 Tax=Porphyromonas gulae TaxID=111105 RepID=A0A0A2GKR3_9PORP|nr:hypothetical protein HR15_09635 [Porphyromonas gulae]KGO02961.1 hypothetical protein HQ42_04040 [Porphyromonas gulae]
MMTSSCQNNSNMKKYNWQPTSSAPVLYPVKIHAAYMRYGKNSALAVPSSARVNNGLGQPGITYSLNDEALYPLPTGLDIVWLSLVDKKFYEARVDFPTDSIGKLLEKGYINDKGEKESYYLVNVGLIPGGRIIIYLYGYQKCIELCSFQGTETEVDMEEFLPNAYFAYKDYEEYFAEIFVDDRAWVNNFKKNGVSHTLWDKYRERFNYDINLEFEDEKSFLRLYGVDFANGEGCNVDVREQILSIRPAARIRLLGCGWTSGEYNFSGYFYFNEEEVLRVFDEAYADNREQKGELKILVSKYNNLFDISLRVGDKVYPIKNTQIRVFKQRPDEGDDQAILVYKNYEGNHTPFVGE